MPTVITQSIRTSFKAFFDAFPVSQYPQVAGTMAALNWAGAGGHSGPTGSHPSAGGMPMDMPYTGWVLQYQYYNATTAARWVNSSYAGRPRELYLYREFDAVIVRESLRKNFAWLVGCLIMAHFRASALV